MTTTLVMARNVRAAELATLSKLTITVLVGYAGLMSYAMISMAGRLDWRGLAFIGVTLVLAGIIASGVRWAPLLGSTLSGLLLIDVAPKFVYTLNHAANPRTIAFQALFTAALIVGVAASIGATAQNYGKIQRIGILGIVVTLALIMAALVTLVLMLHRQGAASNLDFRPTATLPTLTTASFAFDRAEIHAKVGETVTLPLINRDPFAHSFDVDAFNVHVLMLTGEASSARFTPTQPGAYTFYCGEPGHRLHGMVGTLIVEQ